MNKKTKNPGIKYITYFLPKIDYSNQKLLLEEKYKKKLINKIGINRKFSISKNETAINLALKSADKIFKKEKGIKNKIDYIIYCTQSPEYLLPSSSSLIQKKLFPKKYIPAIDINLGCSGFVYSLSIAKSLILSEEASNILLLTADTYSKYISSNNISVKSIFGDGSSASLISNFSKNKKNIYTSDSGTNGSKYKTLIVPNSGLNKKKIIHNDKILKDNELYMDGLEIANFTLNTIPISINKCLKKNKININDIDFFVFHQANKYILNKLRAKLDIPKEKFILDLSNKGNTTSSTIPIALSKLLNKIKNKRSKKVLICGFGVGLSWSTNIVTI